MGDLNTNGLEKDVDKLVPSVVDESKKLSSHQVEPRGLEDLFDILEVLLDQNHFFSGNLLALHCEKASHEGLVHVVF